MYTALPQYNDMNDLSASIGISSTSDFIVILRCLTRERSLTPLTSGVQVIHCQIPARAHNQALNLL